MEKILKICIKKICYSLLILFISCKSNENSQFKEIYNVTISKKEEVILKVYKIDESIVYRLYKNKTLNDELILTNIDLPMPFNIDKKKFIKEKEVVFTQKIGIYGSTFGANFYVFICEVDGYWRIFRDPFPKSEVTDEDLDGFYEIKVLKGEYKSKYFKFNSGLFVEI